MFQAFAEIMGLDPNNAGEAKVNDDFGTKHVITSYSIHYTKLYEEQNVMNPVVLIISSVDVQDVREMRVKAVSIFHLKTT